MTFRFGKSSWKDFSKEELAIIEKERNDKEDVEMDPKKQYGIVCPACTKPNSVSVNFCTGCSFETTKKDIQQLPDNVFMNIILGKDSTVPLFRDDHFLVFNDKFGVSENHLDIIPTKVIEDITFLTKEDIPLLKTLFDLGIKEFESRNIEKYKGKDLKEFVTAGYKFVYKNNLLTYYLVFLYLLNI